MTINRAKFAIIMAFLIPLIFVENISASPYLHSEESVFSDDIRTDDELLILQARLGKYILSDSLIAYSNKGGSVVVAFADMVNILEFPIDVNPIDGLAEGWFISENQRLNLDIKNNNITIGGVKKLYAKELVEIIDNEIFVDIKLLKKWFPIDFKFSLSSQSLTMTSRKKLPIEISWEREKKMARGVKKNERVKKTLPKRENPYKLISFPFSDVTINSNYSNKRNNAFSGDITTSHAMDLLYMNSRINISANDSEGLNDVKFSMSRKDPYGKLMGPMKATSFEIGDIFSQQLPLTSKSSSGRGVSISNFPIDRVTELDKVTLRGEILPNWDIELYRNDMLLDLKKAGDDGRYEFIDVELFGGLNIMKLVFYGPFGEKREEIRRYVTGEDSLKEGESYYNFSLMQNDKDLISVGSDGENDDVNVGDPMLMAEYEYGIKRGMSLFGGVSSVPLKDNKQHNYITTGLSSSFSNILGRMSISNDITDGGSALDFNAQVIFDNINVNLNHEHYFDYLSDYTESLNNPLEMESKVSMSGQFSLESFGSASGSVSASRKSYQNGLTETTIENRLSAFMQGYNISNNLSYIMASGYGDDVFKGNMLLNYTSRKFSLRSDISYSIFPKSDIDNIMLTGDYSVRQDFRLRGGVSHSLINNSTTYSMNLNRLMENYRLGLNSVYDDSGEVTVGLSISLGIGYDPKTSNFKTFANNISNSGIVSANIFIDNDGDGVFGDGDSPMENAKVRANNAALRSLSDKNGALFSAGLTVDTPTSIWLDKSSLDDPYLIPVNEGVEIIPHAGSVIELDFPLVATGEIDGTVFRVLGDESKAASNVQMELVNRLTGKVVSEVRTEYDGFYLFEFVRPGEYIIQVSPEQIARLGFKAPKKHEVTLGYGSEIISNIEFKLSK